MSRYKTILYMIDNETGFVYSQVGSEVAIPVLDWEGMTPENLYRTDYNLEKTSVYDICRSDVIHTRKIPVEVKNIHRKFWGMKPIKKGK